MPTFLRPSKPLRVRAFGLADALVGVLLLGLTAGLVVSGYSDLLVSSRRHQLLVQEEAQSLDAGRYEAWF